MSCPLCGGPATASMCSECAEVLASMGHALPPPDATRTEVVVWAKSLGGVQVVGCRREGREASLHRVQLREVVEWLDDNDWPDAKLSWFGASHTAFKDMQEHDDFPLSEDQIGWVRKVARAADIELTQPERQGPVPKGKPVTLAVDQRSREAEAKRILNPNAPNFWKPTKPPGRR